MRNRAKCKLCQDIIESFHATDYVSCKCGEIIVDGGPAFRCAAGSWDNFIRVEEDGTEIPIEIKEMTRYEISDLVPYPKIELEEESKELAKIAKKDILDQVRALIESIEKLPPHAMNLPVNNYDHLSLLLLLAAALRCDCNELS